MAIFNCELAHIGLRTVHPQWLERHMTALLDLDDVERDKCVLIFLNDVSGFNAKGIKVRFEDLSDLARGRAEIDYDWGIGRCLKGKVSHVL
jgi:hypothetical protein